MATLVDVVNQALIRLGHSTIVALTDSVRAAKIANAESTVLLDDELRRGVWKFSRTRIKLIANGTNPAWGYAKQYTLPDGLGTEPWCIRALEVDGEDEASGRWVVEGRSILTDIADLSDSTAPTVTFLSANVTPVTETINTVTAHGYVQGDGPLRIRAGVGGLPAGLSSVQDYWVIYLTTTTFKLATTAALAAAGTAVDITSTVGTGPHTIGATGLNLLYIGRITDPDQMDAAFRSLLVARYAAEWAEAITGNASLTESCERRLAMERRTTQTSDSQQGIPDANDATDWISSRFSGPSANTGAPTGDFGDF